MELYARLYPLDVALLPIYGYRDDDALQATEAARLMKPHKVCPFILIFAPLRRRFWPNSLTCAGPECRRWK